MPLSFRAHKAPEGPELVQRGNRSGTSTHKMHVLDFDLENRPLSYWYDDATTAEITAFGWSWIGSDKISTMLLTREGTYEDDNGVTWRPRDAMTRFRGLLEEADMVTGHYIRKHDLPLFQAALLEYDLETLSPILAQDTQRDLPKRKDLSASQESLAAMFGLADQKQGMTQDDWREANRLTTKGINAVRERVTSDVEQHKSLRQELLDRNLLKTPKIWSPK